MAKLIALVLAFTAIVALATSHTTIVTTRIEDADTPMSTQDQYCDRRLEGERLDMCLLYIQQEQSPLGYPKHEVQRDMISQFCCHKLQNIEESCQCEAVKKTFQHALKQVQRISRIEGLQFGSQQIQPMRQRAEMLRNQCSLPIKQCHVIGRIATATTTMESMESNQASWPIPFPFWPFGSRGSQQCSQKQIQPPVNQCKSYVEQQMMSSSPKTLQMSVTEQGQQQEGMTECCMELRNLRKECQCEAMKEVAKEVMMRQQQQQQKQMVRGVVQNLPNQCRLDMQQWECNIPRY